MNILVIPLTTALCFEYGLTSNILLENINTKKGQFTSPEYPANYPDNANYTWIIWTGHTAANVTFKIHDMNIKFTNPCDDYLEIKEIDQCCFTAFKRCGELKDWTLVINGNQIRVSFISDRILNAKGFSLSWTVTLPPTTPRPKVTKIRTTIPSKTSVRIYPTKLATNLTTTSATRTASTTKKLTAKKTITTEWKIPLTRELMSAPTTRTFSMALQMTTSPMKAKTYGITTMRPTLASNHFSGTYILRSLTLPEYGLTSNIHLENINTKKGQFTSPGYPANYPDNANYTWIIRTGYTAANVTFKIHDMNIKFATPCDDYLEIKEMDQCCFTAFKKCGELKGRDLVVKGNQIRVSFISDRILNATGFSLSWTVTLPPTTPRPEVTNISITTPSKTSVNIYTSKSTKKLTHTPTTSTASTSTKLRTNVLITTPRTSTTATTAKTTITKLKTPSTRKLISSPTTETFSTALQMTTLPTEAKTYDITTIRPTLASNHLSGTFILRSSTLPVLQQESTTTTMSTKTPSTTTRRISLSKKTTTLKTNLTTKTTSTSTTSTIYTTIVPSTKLTIPPSFITTIASKPSLTLSILTRETTYTEVKRKTTLLTTQLAAMSQSKTSMFTELSTNIPTTTNEVKELSNNIPTNTDEFKVYMITGICIFGAFLIVIGVIIVKRHRSSASKEQISRIEPTGTDGLVNPSTKKAPDNAYTPMPLGSLGSVLPSNVDENVEAVYVEYPDNVYDISRIHRPHVLQQNNIYQTNESIYNTTFAKKDYDINNDSNPYQSCVKQHLIKQNKD